MLLVLPSITVGYRILFPPPISPRLDVVPESRQTVRRTCQKGGTSDDEILRSSRSPPLPQSRCQALEGRCGIARRIHDREPHVAAKAYSLYREGTRVGSSHGATALYQVLGKQPPFETIRTHSPSPSRPEIGLTHYSLTLV